MKTPPKPAAAEAAVRKAASDLKAAIDDAHAAGLRVTWPHNANALASIAISATAAAAQPEPDPAVDAGKAPAKAKG